MTYRITYETDTDFMNEPGFGADGVITRASDLTARGYFVKVYDESGVRVDPRTLAPLTDNRGRRPK